VQENPQEEKLMDRIFGKSLGLVFLEGRLG